MPRLSSRLVLVSLLLAFTCIPAIAADHRVVNDVEYAMVDGHSLKLDLHLPESKQAPLVVWVHGGAWRAGSKADMPLGGLVNQGYAIASVDYRLSVLAPFPAMIHDIKAAIRFLRAHSADLGYDASRIAVAGSSAGGHLAALVGVTNGVKTAAIPVRLEIIPGAVHGGKAFFDETRMVLMKSFLDQALHSK